MMDISIERQCLKSHSYDQPRAGWSYLGVNMRDVYILIELDRTSSLMSSCCCAVKISIAPINLIISSSTVVLPERSVNRYTACLSFRHTRHHHGSLYLE